MTAKRVDWTVPGILGGLAAVLLLMAAVCGGVHRHLTARVERVEGWPTTDAVVVINEMNVVDGLDSSTGTWGKTLRLTLEYTYEVEGRKYTGKNLNVDGTAGKFAHTDYPVGSRMPVRYDPADPSIAGVKMGLKSEMGGHWFIYAGAGLAAVGLVAARALDVGSSRARVGEARRGTRAGEGRVTRIAETALGLDPESRRRCSSA